MTEETFLERTEEDLGSTNYRVMLSGYKWALSLLSPAAGKEVLDCACGRGYGAFYLAGFVGKVSGVDISAQTIEYCRKRYVRANLEFLTADAAILPFADSRFDAIISQDTMEHVRDEKGFLSEMRRVLKPGGTLFIFTPHSRKHNDKPQNIFHLREYSRESLGVLLAGYFADVRYYGKQLSGDLAALEATLSDVRAMDALGIRRVIPRPVRHFIGEVVAFLCGRKLISRITEEDVHFVENPAESLTLVAVCRKPVAE